MRPTLRRQVLSHLTRNTKVMEQLLNPQELKIVTKSNVHMLSKKLMPKDTKGKI